MQIKAEPIGDLAVISRLIQGTNLAKRVDEHLPRHHLWRGMGIGKSLEGLLMYILSESDHRLYPVESWAAEREESLGWLLEEPGFTAGQLNDDRLGNLLDLISKNQEGWEGFLRAHNEALIRLYDLRQSPQEDRLEIARIDSTTAQSHRPLEGLFQLGHNAQKLAMPQIKVMLLALDKGNLPLAEHTVAGNNADDQLYTPILELAWRQGLPEQGILLVGDSKLCNQDNMAFIANSGNYYLGPLAQRQFSLAELQQACQWVEQQEAKPEAVMRQAAGAKQAEIIAKTKELAGRMVADTQGKEHWQRLIAVCSTNRREGQLQLLDQRLAQAQTQIQERFTRRQGRKTLKQPAEAQKVAEQILTKNKVAHLFTIEVMPPLEKASPCQVALQLNEQLLEQEKLLAGWRVMATNAPPEQLSANEAVLCYWEEYRIEQQFHLLLNKCTALQTIFLKKEKRVQALIKVLMLALQYSNLWQYTLRLELSQQQETYLTQVVPSNPGMKVHRPTTKLVLGAFKNIQAIYVELPDGQHFVHIQGFLEQHQRLLRLLRLPIDIYLHPLCQRT